MFTYYFLASARLCAFVPETVAYPTSSSSYKAFVVIVTKANMENFMVVLRWTGTVFVEEGMDNNL